LRFVSAFCLIEDRESQLYDDFEHFRQHKGETTHDYCVRFVTVVKLNRGLRDSNYDQLYAYLKQHKAYANENKMLLDRFTQHTVDPLALISNVAPQQYNSQSSTNPSSTYVPPYFADNSQLDSGLSQLGLLFHECDCPDTMADVNVNALAEQAHAMAPPTRTDDQILPRSRWVPLSLLP
ncbi:hypothetical protein Tco_1580398, partial [Tanacetum coccineum]